MKKGLFTLAMVLFLAGNSVGQIPQGFNYQALARDGDGVIMSMTDLVIEISILSDIEREEFLWIEEHQVTTGRDGLFSLVVGQGTRTGGLILTFDNIDWVSGRRYIRTRISFKGDWMNMGDTRLWSVPYSMVADKALELEGNPVMIKGSSVIIMNNVGIGTDEPGRTRLSVMGDDIMAVEPLFEVKRKDGQTVFAVYNDGVSVNIPITEGKSSKGGFAIGGFDEKKSTFRDYLIINRDSIRMYIDDRPEVKASKGGFAIGGFDEAKGVVKEYLRVTDDSTRVNVNSNTKASKGGFAIGSFDEGKSDVNNFLDLTPENYFIGHQAGYSNIDGKFNAFIGYTSGYGNLSGDYNTMIGYESGFSADADYNTFFGYRTGASTYRGGGNLFMGYTAGESNYNGYRNVFLGYNAGKFNTSGYENTFLGANAGYGFNSGNANIMIGAYSGNYFYGGDNNIFIGNKAGHAVKFSTDVANNNIFIGNQAGNFVQTGSDNLVMGVEAGYSLLTGNNNVLLGNRSGYGVTGGYNNIFIGYLSGENSLNTTNSTLIGNEAGRNFNGDDNVLIGDRTGTNDFGTSEGYNTTIIGVDAGRNVQGSHNTIVGSGAGSRWGFEGSGDYNVFVGNYAGGGSTNKLTFGNVCIGYNAGYGKSGSNKLYIANSDVKTLIYGDFYNEGVAIKGENIPAGYAFYVNGNAGGISGWNSASDARLKKNVASISGALDKVLAMRGVSFEWIDGERFDREKHIGFLAQEVVTIVPEAVKESEGLLSMDYSSLTSVLVEAVKEQQKIIDALSSEVEMLKTRQQEFDKLKAEMEAIRIMLLSSVK
ncbi:MAG: tail fiber domain-containing protein [Bacteroidales bacterium]|jgi:hypothetical protein|nr:tail fiber domain-containing protein [Bacteroidales bacterium]